ncbi:MAG: hypothetical protein ACFBZ8_02015 [Opitutales bacterium]
MSVALSALILILLLLPGFAFRVGLFLQTWRGSLRTRTFAEEAAIAVSFAAAIHAIGAEVASLLGQPVDWQIWLLLVGWADADADQIGTVASQIERHGTSVVAYLLFQVIVGAIAGSLAFRLIRVLRLDLCFDTFRLLGPWDYLFRGEYYSLVDNTFTFREKLQIWFQLARNRFKIQRPEFVWIAAVVPQGQRDYLYFGLLQNFYFTGQGQIDKLILAMAFRRPLSEDASDDLPAQALADISTVPQEALEAPQAFFPDERFYPITGDFFILRGTELRTLNVRYEALELAEDAAETVAAEPTPPA